MAIGSSPAGNVSDTGPPASAGRATHARYWVLVLAFTATLLTYLDRVCVSVAAPGMTRDLGLTRMQMGYVFVAFDFAYAIFGIPVSWLGDRTGQRKLMAAIVLSWSLLTVFTGFAPGFIALMVLRFAFGAAESGAYPTMSRALARWFPKGERARANGVLWMGGRLGGSLAPALAVLCIAHFGWRSMFVIFGVGSVVWCTVYWGWYRDDPGLHASVNALELNHIRGNELPAASTPPSGPTPWGRLFSSWNLWALIAMYFCSSYGFQFFITWMPTFLMKDHGLSLQKSGLYSAFPLLAGTLGCLGGGALADWLGPAMGSVKWARRIIGCGAFLVGAACLGLAEVSHSPLSAIVWLTISMGAHDLMLPVAWATCVDVGGRYGGTASSLMNTGSAISAMLCEWSAAWLAGQFGSFNSVLGVAAGAYVLGGLIWLVIDPGRIINTE